MDSDRGRYSGYHRVEWAVRQSPKHVYVSDSSSRQRLIAGGIRIDQADME
jgi:hypothetical protein